MEELFEITVHKRDGKKEIFKDVINYQLQDGMLFIRQKSNEIKPRLHYETPMTWIPQSDILRVEGIDRVKFDSEKDYQTAIDAVKSGATQSDKKKDN